MTTAIKLITHGWPTRVITTDQYEGQAPVQSNETVPPNSERTFYITQTRTVAFKELPAPDKDPAK